METNDQKTTNTLNNYFSTVFEIEPDDLFVLRFYGPVNSIAGIIFWRDFAIFSHFFARNRIKIPGVRKKIARWIFLISRR